MVVKVAEKAVEDATAGRDGGGGGSTRRRLQGERCVYAMVIIILYARSRCGAISRCPVIRVREPTRRRTRCVIPFRPCAYIRAQLDGRHRIAFFSVLRRWTDGFCPPPPSPPSPITHTLLKHVYNIIQETQIQIGNQVFTHTHTLYRSGSVFTHIHAIFTYYILYYVFYL